MKASFRGIVGAALLLMAATSARASLTTFQAYTGDVGVSTDGCGSVTVSCTLTAGVPAGSTVVAAYIYSSLNDTSTTPGGTLNGNTVTYGTALGVNGTLQAWRSDVTSIVAPVIDANSGSPYTFTVTETQSAAQDGEGLVVVYTNPSLSGQTVGILDGFSASGGDSSSITFTSPLHPGDAGFGAEMRIGDGYSYDGSDPNAPVSSGQVSTITVNSNTVTTVAGHCDDAQDSTCSNGNLITVGAWNDPFTPASPTVGQDHERYNIAPYITDGSTTIDVTTLNPSGDDNIFLEVFQITGTASDVGGTTPTNTSVPEPMTIALLGVGLCGIAAARRRLPRD